MKHMWSEEEIQEQTKIENLVDSKGRNRFFKINGIPGNAEGMQIYYSKCVLNGNNLIFEIEGIFSQNMSADFTLSEFTLPEWIAVQIPLVHQNIVDLTNYNVVSPIGGVASSRYTIYKDGNVLKFWQAQPVDVTNIGFFRIRYNLIIEE